MPFPTAAEFSPAVATALTSVGAPGTIVPSHLTGAPYNPLHHLATVMLGVCAPLAALAFGNGFFLGTAVAPTAFVLPPAPMPFISPAHLRAAAALVVPLALPNAATLAASVGWVGPFGASVPLGMFQGVLAALNGSAWSVAATPGDPQFLALTTGFLSYTWVPLDPASMIGAVTAAWSSDPLLGPGERTQLAVVWCSAFCAALNALSLSCAVLNAAGAGPVVPGVPYPHTLPLVMT